MILKETNDETRKRLKEYLKESTAMYADHAEKKISKLQEVCFRKYLPEQYAYSTEVSHRPQDVPNKRFSGKISALFRGRREDLRESEAAKPGSSKEGISINLHGFQLDLLNRLVSDDDFRMAVSRLNYLRSARAEDLEDGYGVSDLLCYDLSSSYTRLYQCSVSSNSFSRQRSETFLSNIWTV